MSQFDTIMLDPAILKSLGPIVEPNHPSIFGMRVIESPLARMPVRAHKRRRWMSARYHHRIQKKWNKRFGTKPAAFLMNSPFLQGYLAPGVRKPMFDWRHTI